MRILSQDEWTHDPNEHELVSADVLLQDRSDRAWSLYTRTRGPGRTPYGLCRREHDSHPRDDDRLRDGYGRKGPRASTWSTRIWQVYELASRLTPFRSQSW